MTPEEQDIFISRIDEKLDYIQDKCRAFCKFKDKAVVDIALIQNERMPERIRILERWQTYRDGAIGVLLFLVGGGQLWKFIEYIK